MRWGLALMLAACSSTETLRLDLVPDPDHQTLVLAVEDGDDLSVFAYDLDTQAPTLETVLPRYVGAYEVRLTALLYDQPPSALRLSPGEIFEASAPNRRLPAASSTVAATVFGAEIEPFQPVTELPTAVAAFRIDAFLPENCVDDGGCYVADQCVTPCPTERPFFTFERPDRPDPSVCPFNVVTVDGVDTCQAFVGGLPNCAAGETVFAIDTACRPVGSTCPNGWPEDPPAGPRIYVDDNAAPGGTGTMAAPFNDLSDALGAASAGDVLLLRAGDYGGGDVDVPITLFGACPTATRITGTLAPTVPGVTLENLGISAQRHGVDVEGGATVQLTSVIISDTGLDGVRISGTGSAATLNDVLIERTGGAPVGVFSGGSLTAHRVHANESRGLLIDGSSATVSQTIVRSSIPNADGDFGRGMNVQNGAEVEVADSIFMDLLDLGVFVSAAQLTMSRVIVEDTDRRVSDMGAGHGVMVQSGANAFLEEVWITDAERNGVYVIGEGSELVYDLGVIRSTEGRGISVVGDGVADVSRLFLMDHQMGAVHLSDTQGSELSWVHIQKSSRGIQVLGGSNVTITDSSVTEVGGKGVEVDGPATARIERFGVDGSGAADCYFCSGICVEKSGRLEGRQLGVFNATGSAVNAKDDGSTLVVDFLEIGGTLHSLPCENNNPQADFARGIGLSVSDGASADVERFQIDGSAESGVWLAELLIPATDTELDLRDGVVQNNGIGATILLPGFDVSRLAQRVTFVGNGSNLSVDRR